MKILEAYMPAQLGEEELGALIGEAIKEVSAGGPGDMGKVMKVLMPRIAGKSDGGAASRLVREKLSSLPR